MQSTAFEHVVETSPEMPVSWESQSTNRGSAHEICEQAERVRASQAELIFILVFIAGPGVGSHVGKFVGGFSEVGW